MRHRLCCNCFQGDLCDAEIYSECTGANRVVNWLANCNGTVYDCSPTLDCSSCEDGYTTSVSMTLHVWHGDGPGSYCANEDTCAISGGDWTFLYASNCGSSYSSGADGTSPGTCIGSGQPVDFFSSCGDCYSNPNGYGMVQAARVSTNYNVADTSEDDLTWYEGFNISGDLTKYKEGDGCTTYRTGDKALWKITAYQENSNTSIRFRWYFRDCCYHKEFLTIHGGASDGGNTLSGVATCINLASELHGVVAGGVGDKIFTKLSLETWDEEINIVEDGALIYYRKCQKLRYSATGMVDYYTLGGGMPEECVCPEPPSCTVHWGGDDYRWTAYTDWVQVETVDDVNNFDNCVGGTTFTNWTGYGDPYDGDCEECYITDVTFNAVTI